MEKLIYLDNAATTKTSPEVVEAMLPYFTEHYGNPSSVYGFAAGNKEVITRQREIIAEALGAKDNEIYFTAGGTESDNWALTAAAEAYESKGKHIITSKIEHHAVLHTCQYLEKRGYEVTYLDVDENGLVNPADVEAAIRPDTILVSVMFANNEIGTIQPIREIGEITRRKGVLFHTDAVQAFGQIPIQVDDCGIDMLSASGHKLNGPKGIGFLYIRKGVKIRSFIHGGAQERKSRAMIPKISSMTAAPRIALPARVFSLPISLSVSTEMLTEVAVRITPTKIFCRITILSGVPSVGWLKKYVSAKPPRRGTITPIKAITKEALPVFFSSLISVSKPAVNIRMITPSSAICVINSVSVSTFSIAGPRTRPASRAPTT